jgi:hypothetical protein
MEANMDWSGFWGSIGQILAGVLIGAFALWMNKVQGYLKSKNKSMHRIITENMMLKQLLSEVRNFYDADRVELYQFHNGEYFASGTSIQKISMTNFVMARGVSVPMEVSKQNIPIGYVASLTDEIMKSSYVYFSSADLLGESYFKGILRYGGARTALLRGIFCPKHSMIGFVALSWFEDVVLTQEKLAAIKEYSVRIGDELLLGNPPHGRA